MITKLPAQGTIPKNGPVRVLVVDDAPTQRSMLVALLDSDPDVQVVGWATNGPDAVRAAASLHPDVITMDFRMPDMDGLEASRLIMQETPTPIVLVSAAATREDQRMVAQAFEVGIITIAKKPTFNPEDSRAGAELLRTVKSTAQVKVIRRWAPGRMGLPAPKSTFSPTVVLASRRPEVVAIGASTGGPEVLRVVLSQLPASFPVPILVVQHITPGFTAGLVDWLSSQCALPVLQGEPGTRLVTPAIHIAPSEHHLIVQGRALALTTSPPISGHRPSATVLLQSVAREFRDAAIGVLLTGMGEDGAAGIRDLKRAGALTIAQDEASSVVFGMPAAALALGVVDHVLGPNEISQLLMAVTRSAVISDGGQRGV